MEKALQLIILIFITNNFLSAQYIPLVEEGKYWVYLRYSNPDFPSGESGSAISFGGDTLINGLSYKKVYNHTLAGDYDYNYSGWTFTYPYQTVNKGITSFIREDTISRKVYHLPILGTNFCDTEEYLLFDFSLNVGDTLNDCVYESIWASQTGLYPGGIVDSIKMIETQGKLRNAIFTFGFNAVVGMPVETEIAIAEGVGYKDFGVFYRPQSGFFDYCEGGIEECNLIVSNKSVESPKKIKMVL